MIVCDFCGKRESTETYILYSKRIDFCENCTIKANKIKKQIENAIKFYAKEKDKQIRIAEENILKGIDKKK